MAAVHRLLTNPAATGYVQTYTGTLGLSGYSAGGHRDRTDNRTGLRIEADAGADLGGYPASEL